MRLAYFAQIHIDPDRLLRDPWVHDAAHALVSAKRRALLMLKIPQRKPAS